MFMNKLLSIIFVLIVGCCSDAVAMNYGASSSNQQDDDIEMTVLSQHMQYLTVKGYVRQQIEQQMQALIADIRCDGGQTIYAVLNRALNETIENLKILKLDALISSVQCIYRDLSDSVSIIGNVDTEEKMQQFTFFCKLAVDSFIELIEANPIANERVEDFLRDA
jgi:hypothetical protein